MYKHNIMRINFTSYDVRCDEDVIHSGTPAQSNVMVLSPEASDSHFSGPDNHHPFWYARVLGIYHANMIYIGEGNADYLPRQLEFLWVRWYEQTDYSTGWEARRLDAISFPRMDREDAFGFLDPDDVVRACHVIPAMRAGRAHSDGVGLSHCAQDHADWKLYHVNRWALLLARHRAPKILRQDSFADRDMVMRYYWGHAVGHTYTHRTIGTRAWTACSPCVERQGGSSHLTKSTQDPPALGKQGLKERRHVGGSNYDGGGGGENDDENDNSDNSDGDGDDSNDNNNNNDDDGYDDNGTSDGEGLDAVDEESESDEEAAARYEMYGY
jgi:hypothetical protein